MRCPVHVERLIDFSSEEEAAAQPLGRRERHRDVLTCCNGRALLRADAVGAANLDLDRPRVDCDAARLLAVRDGPAVHRDRARLACEIELHEADLGREVVRLVARGQRSVGVFRIQLGSLGAELLGREGGG